jgi:hypothetical protein
MQNEVRGIRDKVRRKKGAHSLIKLMCKLWLCKRNSNAEVDRGKGKGEAHSLINIYKEPIRLLH